MLDHCSISHKGGLVLWSRSFTPTAAQVVSNPATSPVNSLIREVLIEGRSGEDKYEKDGYAIRWTFVNELELIFVVAYQRILQLTYVEDLLTAIKTLFVKLFEPFLATFVASLHSLNKFSRTVSSLASKWDFAKALEGWDKVFDKVLRGLEEKSVHERKSKARSTARVEPPITPSSDEATEPAISADVPLDEQQISRNVQALKNRLRGKGRRRGMGRMESRSGRDTLHASDSDTPSKKKTKAKSQRKWGDQEPTEADMEALDFSEERFAAQPDSGKGSASLDLAALVDKASLGTRGKDGLYEVKDWEFTKGDDTSDFVSRTLAAQQQSQKAQSNGSLGSLGSIFARLTGSKVLTESDLKPVLEGMKQHLMKKNVAKEIADKICEGVGEGLVGKKVGGFQTISATVRQALSKSLTRILTPNTSTDLLLSIRTKLSSPLPSTQQRSPYSFVFVGVNGVGKSTNLSKVCFWLIQNGFKVLIAACDTFRSGAVEQLRVHVRNLGMLDVNGPDGKGGVELFERGYGKDAAGIAREAISYAKDHDFDIVLIDTAGRMQDNEPLMRALAKLVATNNPDKIIFVGEALVGNEAVDQLSKFDRALRDFSSASGAMGRGRGIDGMLVTKWDTVDDKTYTDLRQLRVSNVVQALLSD
ncbi:P-loop containing nucleoside triphosphate hydrolase protein [Sanghuangporus baumii]|uniref:Signal recognition particle receptor subunit alpha homolog n=1 Tax=Sanghuangporus baumii TaxID=108892 RepID=A0A9Q5N842_SANBA|nr:P-loop containing nucleoside triphosphate hydrolase protein [Sanghuangporus baumii]